MEYPSSAQTTHATQFETNTYFLCRLSCFELNDHPYSRW